VVSVKKSFIVNDISLDSQVDWHGIQSNYYDNATTLTRKMVQGMQEKAIAGQLLELNNLDCINAYAHQAETQYATFC
jgi:hypothetical protein